MLAYAGFGAAEWSTWIAILVYAYGVGGATGTGVVAFIQLVPAAVAAPFFSTFSDRYRRDKALAAGYAVQCGAVTATTLALVFDAPLAVLYALAAADASAMTLTRPTQGALLPLLARTPEELTAANVATGAIESISMLTGPAGAGLLLAVGNAGLVYLVMAVVLFLSTLMVTRIGATASVVAEVRTSVWSQTLEGFRYVVRDRRASLLIVLSGGRFLQEGAMDVLLVVLGISLLDMSESGVGYLNAVFGAGGLVGASLAVLLIGRRRLGPALLVAALLFALALVALGMASSRSVAIALLVAGGCAHIVMDVSSRTLLQRTVPNELLGRTFGLLEGLAMVGLAAGSILVPPLIALGDETTPFFVVGGGLAVLVAAGCRPLLRLDADADVPERELALLRNIPIFSPLPGPVIERLAVSMRPLMILGEDVVVSLGDKAEHFFVIGEGTFEVSVRGHVVNTLEPGGFFGEVALLRDVPRTATVTAKTTGLLYTLDRDDFIEAVTGFAPSKAAADEIVTERSQPP
jgi:MFS family permease